MIRFSACAFALALVTALFSCSQQPTITVPGYALVIGVQNYPNASHLQYTLDDATAMAQLLPSPRWSTTVDLDANATRGAIVADLTDLAARAEPDSTVVLYFSGHGDLTNDGSTGLIAPYDTDFLRNSDGSIIFSGLNPLVDERTVITAPQFASILSHFATKNIIVVLDCCFAGNFVSPGSSIDASPQNYENMQAYSGFSTALAKFSDLLSANAVASGSMAPIVISASGASESSYDGTINMKHGVFTYFFLQAATHADTNGDGLVTTTEAFAYTKNAIVAWGASLTLPNLDGFLPFLPHISGGTRDLVLFGR